MIYRVDLFSFSDGSSGYIYCTSRRVAERAGREWVEGGDSAEVRDFEIDEIPTPKTKAQVISILNRYAVHPNNG